MLVQRLEGELVVYETEYFVVCNHLPPSVNAKMEEFDNECWALGCLRKALRGHFAPVPALHLVFCQNPVFPRHLLRHEARGDADQKALTVGAHDSVVRLQGLRLGGQVREVRSNGRRDSARKSQIGPSTSSTFRVGWNADDCKGDEPAPFDWAGRTSCAGRK